MRSAISSHFQYRSRVKGLEVPHAEACVLDRHDLDPVHSDRVGWAGAGAEHGLLRIGRVSARVHPQHVAACAMKPRENDHLEAGLEVAKTVANRRVEMSQASGDPSSPCLGASAASTSADSTHPIARTSYVLCVIGVVMATSQLVVRTCAIFALPPAGRQIARTR
jgi:hypothetical protein